MKTLLMAAMLSAIAAVGIAQTFVDAGDGVRIWYKDTGTGSPIIVIHGGPGMDHATLEADLAPLAKDHRMIYYDQRGGGLSTLPSDPARLTIDDHVRDLEALRKHLGLDKVTLLAHSFGPAIATMYAIRHTDHVEQMVFIAPIPPRKGTFFDEFGANIAQRLTKEQAKRAEQLQKSFATASDVKAVCRRYWSIMMPPRLAKGSPVSVVKSDMCAAPPDAIRYGWLKTNPTTFSSLGDWYFATALIRVRIRTLIIHGEEDAIPMKLVADWVSALPNARLLSVAHAAHFPHAEQPQIVFPAIETFLAGSWPAGAVGR